MVPRLMLPDSMQKIGLVTPHGWALDGYYDILIREGVDFATITPELCALLIFSLVFAAIGAALYRFE